MTTRSNLKRLFLAACALCMLGATPALADVNGKKLGLGLGGGTLNSGLTGKFYLGESTAAQIFVGNRFGWGLSVSADYIVEFAPLAKGSAGKLFWGAGVGAGLIMYAAHSSNSSVIGVSGVVELGWHFAQVPLELIIDWRPTFFIGDHIGGLYLEGSGSAIRWYF